MRNAYLHYEVVIYTANSKFLVLTLHENNTIKYNKIMGLILTNMIGSDRELFGILMM